MCRLEGCGAQTSFRWRGIKKGMWVSLSKVTRCVVASKGSIKPKSCQWSNIKNHVRIVITSSLIKVKYKLMFFNIIKDCISHLITTAVKSQDDRYISVSYLPKCSYKFTYLKNALRMLGHPSCQYPFLLTM